ncbi:SMI1/KNR4 family protein [Actinomadura bangladeshensis]|uniref:SMI1/KNR4 family protein n=1 Tax=Actinomadura bangladeshensis TaxID=453573 RepID=A0A4R4N8N8_9ACTN|nr:SMI1/KNR4 family protein [Actinomadura bangladeshensis]TDC05259.1 SMI1/KNR4 family protein [Actinomadura bangladeshensis]
MSTDADGIEQLTAAWGRIEAWLGAHAPASAALLRAPASEAGIAAAESALEVQLPATLAAWYRIHDGMAEDQSSEAPHVAGILPSRKTMLPLDRVVSEYRTRTGDWAREAGIVPFARTPGDGWSGWYIDARRDAPSFGNLGSWAVDQADEPYPWPSDGWPLPDWLTETAAALEQGRPLRRPDGTEETGDRPALYLGGLTWVDARDLHIDAVVLDGPR